MPLLCKSTCHMKIFRDLEYITFDMQRCIYNVCVTVQNAGSKDDFAAKMKTETEQRLQTIDKEVAANKEKVIDRLLELIYDIKPEVHKNYKQPKTA